MELLFGVRRVRFRVRGLLTPTAVHRENEHVRAIHFLIDYGLRPPAGRGHRVLPAERDELHPGPVAEAAVQVVDHLLERPPLDRQIARRGDEDVNQSRLGMRRGHRGEFPTPKEPGIPLNAPIMASAHH